MDNFYSNIRPETIEIARVRAKEMKERGETKFFVLQPEKDGKDKPEILVGARMQGAINALVPVVEELSRRGYPVSFLADNPAEKTIRAKFPSAKEVEVSDPLQVVAERDPGLILSGLSINGGPGIEFYLTTDAEGDQNAGIRKIPTVWVEDFWKASTRGQDTHRVFPDVICSFDEDSRKMNEAALEKDDPVISHKIKTNTKFVVTGSPAFDQLSQEKDIEQVRERVRTELKMKDGQLLITYIGDMPPEDLENLQLLVEALNQIDFADSKPKFTARIHPAIYGSGPLSVHKREYERIISQLTSCDSVDTMSLFSTDEVAKSTDAIISDFSTEGVKAVYRGKLSLFMLLPKLGLDCLKRDTDGMETLPVIESGASVGVFKKEDLFEKLRGLLLDENIQSRIRSIQQSRYKLDGKNMERVVEVIEDLLKAKN